MQETTFENVLLSLNILINCSDVLLEGDRQFRSLIADLLSLYYIHMKYLETDTIWLYMWCTVVSVQMAQM